MTDHFGKCHYFDNSKMVDGPLCLWMPTNDMPPSWLIDHDAKIGPEDCAKCLAFIPPIEPIETDIPV